MRGIAIILGEAAPERFRTALTIAAATAALGGRARILCQNEAVALLRLPLTGLADRAHAAAGLPTLAELYEDAIDLGVVIIACQSGLALTGLGAAMLDRRVTFGGMIGLLQDMGEDRLLSV